MLMENLATFESMYLFESIVMYIPSFGVCRKMIENEIQNLKVSWYNCKKGWSL